MNLLLLAPDIQDEILTSDSIEIGEATICERHPEDLLARFEDNLGRHPDILAPSSCKYLVFETPDPEVWTAHEYIVVKVDSRGSGKSPGKLLDDIRPVCAVPVTTHQKGDPPRVQIARAGRKLHLKFAPDPMRTC